jgi:hypothetical protein
MLGKQAIANAANPGSLTRIARDVHGEVAFGIDAHRSAREVGGADPHQPVVNDHYFRVNERRHVSRARRRGIDEPQPLVRVGGNQLPEHVVTECAHGVLFQPAMTFRWRDHHHLRTVRLAKTYGQRVGQRVVREVLAFDVDRVFRRGNGIQKQRFAFAD